METKNEKRESDNCELFRFKEGFSPETVLLIGNGAIENGILPLEKFAYSAETKNKHDQPVNAIKTQNPTIHFLARMVYLYRSAADMLLLKAARIDKINTKNYEEIDKIGPYLHGLKQSRIKLADAYANATRSNKIFLRNRELFQEYYLNDNTGIITINWDEVLWKDDNIVNIIQLHGRCSIQESLVLPTELTIDTNIFKLFDEGLLKNMALKKDYLSRYYRGNINIIQSLEAVHKISMKWLENAKKLIIWGVAFNVYDAELISLFPPPPFNELKEIVIINPNITHRNIAAAITGEGVQNRIDIDPITGKEINA